MKYAQQMLFGYGWDYFGSEDGKRVLFDTEQEANDDLDEFIADVTERGMDYSREDYRVIPYDPADDILSDLK